MYAAAKIACQLIAIWNIQRARGTSSRNKRQELLFWVGQFGADTDRTATKWRRFRVSRGVRGAKGGGGSNCKHDWHAPSTWATPRLFVSISVVCCWPDQHVMSTSPSLPSLSSCSSPAACYLAVCGYAPGLVLPTGTISDKLSLLSHIRNGFKFFV